MEKINKNQKIENWRNVLYSYDIQAIRDLLIVLREEGSVEILADLINVYKAYKEKELGKLIFSFLVDLKNQDNAELLLKFINNIDYKSIKTELISLCWQTTLNFDSYFENFIDIFINSDFETAIEAFSVIEYMNYFDKQQLELNIKKLQINIGNVSEEKKALLVDLVNVLREKLD